MCGKCVVGAAFEIDFGKSLFQARPKAYKTFCLKLELKEFSGISVPF